MNSTSGTMSEVNLIATFQSQLSGVMETVFKAAMYEITRLVEDSFLEEVVRCRQQVESLKRRLRWSESRRREREADCAGKCVDCGNAAVFPDRRQRETQTETILKQEAIQQEEMNGSQDGGGDTQSHEMIEQSSTVQNVRLDKVLKEEALHMTSDSSELQEKWGQSLDESGHPGSSKQSIHPKIPKFQVNWEDSVHQKTDPGQHADSVEQSEVLYHQRYCLDELGDFGKTGYDGSDMMDMGSLDGFQESPVHLGDDLSYMDHYGEDLEAAKGPEQQAYQSAAPRNRRDAIDSPTDSSARTGLVSGEFSCLLINEEGYLQDTSILYPEHASGDSSSRVTIRGPSIRIGNQSFDNKDDHYQPPDTLQVEESLQHQSGGRGGRRYACNQCSMLFPDSASLRAHRQTHKAVVEGPPFSCHQCGMSFAQACNLKVHQKIHIGQGLHLCSHCGKGFPSFSDLKIHKCGPTRDKPYCCTVCGNKFSRLWNLKLHQRIHTQEKPHQCTMCDKSFTRADILKVHQRTHTGERPYTCNICGISFKRLDHLKSHQRKHMADL